MRNWPFHRSLHGRGMTHEKIAAATGLRRSLVSKAIGGLLGGKTAREKIAPFLTLEEKVLLGWQLTTTTSSTGNIVHHD